jgi:membrane protease YdiL (CAAX protease family)
MSVAPTEVSPASVRTKRSAAFWIVATAFAPLFLYAIFSSFFIGGWYAITRHQGPPTPEVILNSILVTLPPAEWGVVLVWWLIQRRRTAFADLFGLRTRGLAVDSLVGVVLGAAWVSMYGLGDVVAFADMFRLDLAKLSSVPLSVTAGCCEELLCRGFLFTVIAQAGGGWKSKLVWTSVAFSLMHVLWGPWGMGWTFLLAATFGAVTLWRRSIWAAVIAHTILDLCIEPGLFVKAFQGGFGS